MFHPAGGFAAASAGNTFFSPAPAVQASAADGQVVQREESGEAGNEEKKEEKNPLTEGLKTTGAQLLKNKKFKAWFEPKLEILKDTLWKDQPTEAKAAMLTFMGINLGVAGLALALNPELGKNLSGVNIGKPLGSIPFSPVEGFKFKLPKSDDEGLGLSADFTLNPHLKALRKRFPGVPLSALTLGLDTRLGGEQGGFNVTGGKFGLGFFGGGLSVEGKTFNKISAPPVHFPGTFPGDPGGTLVKSFPELPPLHEGPGAQVMIKADLLKLFPKLRKIF